MASEQKTARKSSVITTTLSVIIVAMIDPDTLKPSGYLTDGEGNVRTFNSPEEAQHAIDAQRVPWACLYVQQKRTLTTKLNLRAAKKPAQPRTKKAAKPTVAPTAKG